MSPHDSMPVSHLTSRGAVDWQLLFCMSKSRVLNNNVTINIEKRDVYQWMVVPPSHGNDKKQKNYGDESCLTFTAIHPQVSEFSHNNGGCNPLDKIRLSKWESSPGRGEQKKHV